MSKVKYQGIIDLAVENNSHTMAFNFIEKVANGKSLRILEVGCSSGYFGSALKSSGHYVWGIEPNQASALLASEKLDYVFTGFFEEFLNGHSSEKFDVIVFGDVLEHIADPSDILKKCHCILIEGGAIVASVPNIAHITTRAMLLEGRWEYSDLGILDRTHLRFFTRQTIQELFYDSGYAVVQLNAVKLAANVAAHASKMQLNDSAVNHIDSFALDDRKYDFQYVLLAVPAGARQGNGSKLLLEQSPSKILALVHDVNSSIVDVRLRVPLKEWSLTCGGEVEFRNMSSFNEEIVSWADIIIIQRFINIYTSKWLEQASLLGKKVIFEIDDLLIELPEFLSHHRAGLTGYLSALENMAPQFSYITVTTNRLAKQMERFSRPIMVIPNTVGDEHLGRVDVNSWKMGQATLIVASTDSVLVNFILPAISSMINRKDITLKLVVIGPPADSFENAGIEFEKVPNMPYAEFKTFIRTLSNPIGIIPLDNSLFSSCKSPIKYFDYSLAGIPVICSDVPPYSDVIKNNVTGILVSNETDDWINAIEKLVQSVSLREEISQNAIAYVGKNYSVENAVKNWDLLFQKLRFKIDDFSPSIKRIPSFSKKITTLKFLLLHAFNYDSYKGVIRIIRRDGWKTLIDKILSI